MPSQQPYSTLILTGLMRASDGRQRPLVDRHAITYGSDCDPHYIYNRDGPARIGHRDSPHERGRRGRSQR
jgi:hypothetical protein